MADEQPHNPLHGVTLQAILEDLVARHDWPGLAAQIDIACFKNDPSVKSSLKFLRKTPWARAKVERIYVADQRQIQRKHDRNQRRAARRRYRAQCEQAVVDGDDDEIAQS